VDPESWDNRDQPCVAYWGDLLIITRTPAVHAGIESFLDALRRASR